MKPEGAPPRHVLIYGPPAAGKYTVARLFSERHGFALLDNHATFDLANRLFEFGNAAFFTLIDQLRTTLLRAAAEEGRDVVSTLVYCHPDDRGHVDRLLAAFEGGLTTLVQLRPPPETVLERVAAPSRAQTNKLKDPDVLRRMMESGVDVYTPINDDDLTIDNRSVEPAEVVRMIAARVWLEDPPGS